MTIGIALTAALICDREVIRMNNAFDRVKAPRHPDRQTPHRARIEWLSSRPGSNLQAGRGWDVWSLLTPLRCVHVTLRERATT